MQAHDVVIIGAGPVGALAAHAFARDGARVALLEANPNATTRLAGEWIHPPGVAVLDRLRAGRLEDQHARVGYGFAVIPDDGSPPIELSYPDGIVALACEHRGIVESLRARALGHSNVTYLPATRAIALDDHAVVIERGRSGSREEVQAALIIGADGRSSVTARQLGAGDGELQSYMAAIELRDVELPREGLGHLLLGGPGPALLYRLDDDRVRACLDVPLAFGGAARTLQFLWDGFAPAFPPRLREALRRALEHGHVLWAATRFRPRAHYRNGHVLAIGDAVGHCHPLTAIGLTQGFLDAEAAAMDAARSYPGERVRDSYAAELLASSLYNVLRRDDRSSSAIRAAIYDAWRSNPALRELSIQLLIGSVHQPVNFARIFGQLTVAALGREVREARRSPRRALARAAAFREWLPWGVSAIMPEILRATYREHATASAPVPGLRPITNSTELVSVVQSPELDREKLSRALAAATTALRNVASLLCSTEDDISWLMQVALLRDGADDLDRDRLARATRALVDAQARDGGFGDAIATELACRALRLVPADDKIDHALARAAAWLRARQADDGAQPGPDQVASTAASIEALLSCGVPATDPVVRRGVRWLVRQQAANGAWQDARGVVATLWATARAVNALAVASYFRGARELGTAVLGDLVASALLEDRGDTIFLRDPRHAPILAESVRALASTIRTDGHLLATRSRPGARARDEDLVFCQEALGQVSRTFVRPIGMLPEQLSVAVSCGYLLCRIADTIEDHPAVAPEQREPMFGVFLDTLAGAAPGRLARAFEAIPGQDAELSLGRNCARVMRVLEALHHDQREACRRWIAEMARGMNLYVQRPPGPDQIIALTTLADLERYCYFVAGTVGHLLTDLFTSVLDGTNVAALRADAERFGTGLQLVNILKDVAEDRGRGWSYIPRSSCAEHGLEVRALLDIAHRHQAHAAVAPVFAMARERLDGALRYALAVPAAHTGVRLFCLLPLWMAVRTLVLAHGNDAIFEPEGDVKISRAEVESLTTEVIQLVADDAAIALRYLSLWETPA